MHLTIVVKGVSTGAGAPQPCKQGNVGDIPCACGLRGLGGLAGALGDDLVGALPAPRTELSALGNVDAAERARPLNRLCFRTLLEPRLELLAGLTHRARELRELPGSEQEQEHNEDEDPLRTT